MKNKYTFLRWLIRRVAPVLLWGIFCYAFAGLILPHAGSKVHLLIGLGCATLAVLEVSGRTA